MPCAGAQWIVQKAAREHLAHNYVSIVGLLIPTRPSAQLSTQVTAGQLELLQQAAAAAAALNVATTWLDNSFSSTEEEDWLASNMTVAAEAAADAAATRGLAAAASSGEGWTRHRSPAGAAKTR